MENLLTNFKKCLLQCDKDSFTLYRTYIMVYLSDIENKQAGFKHPMSAEMAFLVKVRGYRESDRKSNLMRQPKQMETVNRLIS